MVPIRTFLQGEVCPGRVLPRGSCVMWRASELPTLYDWDRIAHWKEGEEENAFWCMINGFQRKHSTEVFRLHGGARAR